MKVKIVAALKTKYANLGFGEKAFDGVAEYLSKTVTDESQIETVINGVEPLLKAFQGDVDKLRTELAQKKSELEELKKKVPEPPKPEPPKPEPDEPAWFKSWKEEQSKKIETLERENQQFKAERAKAERAAKVAEKVKELGIPAWRMKGVVVPEELDENGITTFLTEIKQELVTAGLTGQPVSGLHVGKDEALKQMADVLVEKYAVEEAKK